MSKRAEKKKRLLQKEIKLIMYGHGDVPNVLDESADMMEELLMIFIRDLCARSMHAARGRRPKMSDFLFALRKDQPKLVRVHQLLAAEKELAKAKAILSLDEIPGKGNAATAEAKEEGGLALPTRGVFVFGNDS